VLSTPDRRAVFQAVCFGKTHTKSILRIMKSTKLSRKKALMAGKKLADEQLVHQTKVDGMVAYQKDSFYASNKTKIITLATNRAALAKLPTKVNPAGSRSNKTTTLRVKSTLVKIQQITVDDIESFEKVRRFKRAALLPRTVSETTFKRAVQTILKTAGKFSDWGGEKGDLYTTTLKLKGVPNRLAVAFAFKGPGMAAKVLVPGKLGKNGDQIQRLFGMAAQVFIVQYWSLIGEAVVAQMQTFATSLSYGTGQKIYFGIIDGQDSERIRSAYPRLF
jgi:hypothetical protein